MLNERNTFQRVICRIPFSSRDKYKITAITHSNDANKTRVIIQGAAEIIIEYSMYMLNDQQEPA